LEIRNGELCQLVFYILFLLSGAWIYDKEKHNFYPILIPKEEACFLLAKWHLSKPIFQQFYHPKFKILMIDAIAKKWNVDKGCIGYAT